MLLIRLELTLEPFDVAGVLPRLLAGGAFGLLYLAAAGTGAGVRRASR